MTEALVVLPDPQQASLPALVLACDRMTHLLRTEPPQDLETATDLLDKMAAIETFLSKKGMAWAAQTPARLLEACVGDLLGDTSQGQRTDLTSPHAGKLQKTRRQEFRLLAEWRPAWEPALPLSRRAALVRIEQVRHPAGDAPALETAKRYGLVYADPPWPMPTGVEDRSMERHYPAMPIEAIAAMPVAEICRDNALLYLWAISTHLHDAFHVIESWGFEYVSSMVWVKDRPGTGWWVRHQHEYLLIGRRGEWSPPPYAMRPVSIIEAPRTKHSVKPVEVAEMLERLWPEVPRIELFSRAPRPGWDAIGDEAA
jgi:N6-adenosine-specific RNA methylase IME4